MVINKPISPEWSHALAVVAQSPIWNGQRGQKAKDAFMDEAERYASYDDLPPRLKAVYQKAARKLPGQRESQRETDGRSRH